MSLLTHCGVPNTSKHKATVDGIFPKANISMIKINMAVVLKVFFWSVDFRVKTSVIYLLILTVCLFLQSFLSALSLKNVETATLSFGNETLAVCVMIFRQTVPFERYLEIGHVLGGPLKGNAQTTERCTATYVVKKIDKE
jgi:hypothetical protein